MRSTTQAMFRVLSLLMLFGLAACAGGTAMMVQDQPPPSVRTDQSLIVFMRPSNFGGAISASVYDVSEGDSKFIGFVNTGMKLGYAVAPGERTFMVVSEAADFLKATMEPGKSYYALVAPRTGLWRARFPFRPLRRGDLDGSEFAGWNANSRFVATTPAAEAWARRSAPSVATKRATYWPEWTGKSVEQRQSQTLNAEDGR